MAKVIYPEELRRTSLRTLLDYTEPFWMDGLNGSKTPHFPITDEVEILLEVHIDDDNSWGATIDVIFFRHPETGFLGYHFLYPGGYSTMTYDPTINNFIYNTDDFDWFFRMALTDDIREITPVQNFISAYYLERDVLR